jgi:hypothetical protein
MTSKKDKKQQQQQIPFGDDKQEKQMPKPMQKQNTGILPLRLRSGSE